MATRKCCKCGEVKPLTEYYKDKTQSTGRSYRCKSCSNKHYKKYYQEESEARKEYSKDYYYENQENYIDYHKKRYHNNKDYYKDYYNNKKTK